MQFYIDVRYLFNFISDNNSQLNNYPLNKSLKCNVFRTKNNTSNNKKNCIIPVSIGRNRNWEKREKTKRTLKLIYRNVLPTY